jgi:energy-coupling factor transporter ATPase
MTPIIRIENLHHTYQPQSERPVHALAGIDLTIEPGEYVVIVGHNGSGKSTLARHLNGLLLPTQGNVWVKEWNTRQRGHLRAIRSTVGMVFQQPDNQIVASIVEEDVAFGPENLGVPREEIARRVDWSLEQVRMQPYRMRAPHMLSGGQKQRICIAGVLAMNPAVIVLDEATAMLDPLGRNEVLEIAHQLHRTQGVTIIAVTHFMREAVAADRVVVMSEGQVALDGPPRQIFRQAADLRALHLDVPHISALAQALHARTPSFPPDLLTPGEITAAIVASLADARGSEGGAPRPSPLADQIVNGELSMVNGEVDSSPHPLTPSPAQPLADARGSDDLAPRPSPLADQIVNGELSMVNGEVDSPPHPLTPSPPQPLADARGSDDLAPRPSPLAPPIITVSHLTHFYMSGTPLAVQALFDINLTVQRGEIVGIIGHTGSGKSTAIQHLNGLLRADGGQVVVFDQDLAAPGVDVRAIRRRVGLVFQMPEAQLFEQYVGDDVAYGPRKLGLSREEVRERVRKAMDAVGLPFAEFKDRVTFRLSGGQMRRAALAGVLALEPEVLVLDEPTAGLDPQARRQLMERIVALRAAGITLVIISHNMEELAEICDRLYVLADGRTVMAGAPAAIFGQAGALRALGLDVPDVTVVVDELVAAGLLPQGTIAYTLEQAVAVVGGLLAPAA